MPKQGKNGQGAQKNKKPHSALGARSRARSSKKGSGATSAGRAGTHGKRASSQVNRQAAARGGRGGQTGVGRARSGRNSWQSKRKGSSFGTPRGRAQGKAQRQDTSARKSSHSSASLSEGSVVEGRRAVAEAIEAKLPARRAYIAAHSHGQDPTIARLAAKLQERGIPIEEVSRSALDTLSYHGAHQGIALEVEPFAYADIHEIIEAAGTSDALVICLDHVGDEGNLGAIARSAECVGAAGLVIANKRAAGVGPGAYKASAGALAHLMVAQVPNIASAVDELKRAGFWAVCATEHAQELMWESDLSGRLCLVVGAEDTGVSRLVRERCDAECALPQKGAIESLNVAQATTVFAYEWLRQTLLEQKAEHTDASLEDSSARSATLPAALDKDSSEGSREKAPKETSAASESLADLSPGDFDVLFGE